MTWIILLNLYLILMLVGAWKDGRDGTWERMKEKIRQECPEHLDPMVLAFPFYVIAFLLLPIKTLLWLICICLLPPLTLLYRFVAAKLVRVRHKEGQSPKEIADENNLDIDFVNEVLKDSK